MPRVCPTCEGAGMRAASVGGAFTMNETCPTAVAAASSSTTRARSATAPDAACRPARSRPASPPGSRTASASGCAARAPPGEHGGPPGDLYVVVKVSPHPLFGRKADNLTLTVPVRFDEAALGAEIKVPTLTAHRSR